MKKHRVKVRYIFVGYYDILADDKSEARAVAEQHCGMMMGSGIRTSNDYQVKDWDFPMHPEVKIVSVTSKK